MAEIVYSGPHDEVDVVGFGPVVRDTATDIPDDLAKRLVEQADWSKPEPKRTAK